MSQKMLHLLLGLMALMLVGCSQAIGDQTGRVQYPFVLTQEEISAARALAERDLMVDSLPSGPKTVFIKVDLLPDSQANTAQRLVMVHHYRYHADQTIFTMVDLNTHEILGRDIQVHYPTALAPAEMERALSLARADDRLRPLLQAGTTKLEARPIQYAAPEEPLFGHRVVHVLLRREGNYLVSPHVLVDLTNETIHMD
jgi:hypothetical protein